jgi:hypothetical protein
MFWASSTVSRRVDRTPRLATLPARTRWETECVDGIKRIFSINIYAHPAPIGRGVDGLRFHADLGSEGAGQPDLQRGGRPGAAFRTRRLDAEYPSDRDPGQVPAPGSGCRSDPAAAASIPRLIADLTEIVTSEVSWLFLRNTMVCRQVPKRSTIERVRSAGADAYDDVPYEELPIETVDWQHRADYIRHRSVRKGQANEFDVEPEWATEAALDPKGSVGDGGSESGETIKAVGYSPGAGRVLTVLLLPKDHPPSGDWWGVNAWAANTADERGYRQRDQDPGATEQ